MFSDFVHAILPEIIAVIELIGIIVVTLGCLKSFFEYIKETIAHRDVSFVRHRLGLAMVTGLEFKMAAEILRTVLVREQEELIMLGGIIILRAVLSYLIKKDIESSTPDHVGKSDKPPIVGIRLDRK